MVPIVLILYQGQLFETYKNVSNQKCRRNASHLFKQARFSREPLSPLGQRMTIHVEQGSSSPREALQELVPKQTALLKHNTGTAEKGTLMSVNQSSSSTY